MTEIFITIENATAKATRTGPLTSGMVGVPVQFAFDKDWDGLDIIAVFEGSGVVIDRILDKARATTVPHEVLADSGAKVLIGAKGYDTEGNLIIPSTMVVAGRVLTGADPSMDESTDPSLPVWAQIQANMGDTKNLETEDKENLVAAINEVNADSEANSKAILAMVQEIDVLNTHAENADKAIGDAEERIAELEADVKAAEKNTADLAKEVNANSKAIEDLMGEDNTVLSEGAVAFGKGNTVGLKGYYWSHIDFATNTITLCAEQVTPTAGKEANLISFTIDGTAYQAEEGMTWEQWIASDYNTPEYTHILLSGVETVLIRDAGHGSYYGVSYDGAFVPITDTIVADRAYVKKYGPHTGGSN